MSERIDRSVRIIIEELGGLSMPSPSLLAPVRGPDGLMTSTTTNLVIGLLVLCGAIALGDPRIALALLLVPLAWKLRRFRRQGPLVRSTRHPAQARAADVVREWAKKRELNAQTADTNVEVHVQFDAHSYLTLYAAPTEIRLLFRMPWLPLRLTQDPGTLSQSRGIPVHHDEDPSPLFYAALSREADPRDDATLWLPDPVRVLLGPLVGRGLVIRGGGEVLVPRIAYKSEMAEGLMRTLDRLGAAHRIWRRIEPQSPRRRATAFLNDEYLPSTAIRYLEGWASRDRPWLEQVAADHVQLSSRRSRAHALQYVAEDASGPLLAEVLADSQTDSAVIRDALALFADREPAICADGFRSRCADPELELRAPLPEFFRDRVARASTEGRSSATVSPIATHIERTTPAATHATTALFWGMAWGVCNEVLESWGQLVIEHATSRDLEMLDMMTRALPPCPEKQQLESLTARAKGHIDQRAHTQRGALTVAGEADSAGLSLADDPRDSILRRPPAS